MAFLSTGLILACGKTAEFQGIYTALAHSKPAEVHLISDVDTGKEGRTQPQMYGLRPHLQIERLMLVITWLQNALPLHL